MKTNGASFDAEGREKILGWLTAKSTFDTKCSACHGTDRPLGKSKSRADWTSTVQRMSGKKPGHLSDAEAAAVAAYLSIVRRRSRPAGECRSLRRGCVRRSSRRPAGVRCPRAGFSRLLPRAPSIFPGDRGTAFRLT